jgi:hypothetical protein
MFGDASLEHSSRPHVVAVIGATEYVDKWHGDIVLCPPPEVSVSFTGGFDTATMSPTQPTMGFDTATMSPTQPAGFS